MPPGAVIVDLAAERGGNCEATKPGETIDVTRRDDRSVRSTSPATVPNHASQMYSQNVLAFLKLLVRNGKLLLDLTDEVVAGTLLAKGGEVVHPAVREAARTRSAAAADAAGTGTAADRFVSAERLTDVADRELSVCPISECAYATALSPRRCESRRCVVSFASKQSRSEQSVAPADAISLSPRPRCRRSSSVAARRGGVGCTIQPACAERRLTQPTSERSVVADVRLRAVDVHRPGRDPARLAAAAYAADVADERHLGDCRRRRDHRHRLGLSRASSGSSGRSRCSPR